jgi:integrase
MASLFNWFRDKEANDVRPQDIDRRLNEVAETGRKPATLNRYRALLSLTYAIANRNGKLQVNPARLVRLRRENNCRVRFLADPEEASLRAKVRELYPECEPEFDLALHTGMRRGEQYRLRWQDVDFRTGIITIPLSKHGEKRHIPMNPIARESLVTLRQGRTGPGYVCTGLEGPRSRDWRRWFEECVSAAKIADMHWHDLRHTFASRLVMSGVDLRTVQELMGHKTIAMTVRYSHLARTHLQEAVERLSARRTDTSTDTDDYRENEIATQATA